MHANGTHYFAFAVLRGVPGRPAMLRPAGHAHVNADGSITICLDRLPLGGQLHLLQLPLHWHRVWGQPAAQA